MLGIVLHTMAIYTEGSDWRINSPVSTAYAEPILDVIHLFRMPAFFIISGFFAALALSKRSARGFLTDRLQRLGVPLLFAGIAFNIPIDYLLGRGPSGDSWINYLMSGNWLGHLWFLGVLVVYSVVTAISWKWLELLANHENKNIAVAIALCLAITYPVALRIGWKLESLGVELIFIKISDVFQYYSYFLLGILYKIRIVNIPLSRNLYKWIVLSIGSFFIWCVVEVNFITDILKFIMTGIFSFTLFTLAECLFSDAAIWKRKFAESSYTVYLVHQPIIIILAIFIISKDVNVHVQVFGILIFSTTLSLGLYFGLVDRNRYMAFLFTGKPLKKIKK
jgi:glucan biosynthesis protein C